MRLRDLCQEWWAAALFPLLFIALGCSLLPYPGLQNDEVLFAVPLFSVHGDVFELHLFGRNIPIMFLSYLGAAKAWLYAPILWLFAPSQLSIRLPAVLVGALTVGLFGWLLQAIWGRRAAWAGTALLATDTMFLLTTCFDWGPVVLQHFFLVAGILSGTLFARRGHPLALFFGSVCFGLGMWDKALFIWMLSGVVVAAALVFPRELLKRMTARNLALAAAGFCLGALPLIVYNAESGFGTFRSTSAFRFDQFPLKLHVLRNTWNGIGLYGYLAPYASMPGPTREAQGALERGSEQLRSLTGVRSTNRMEGALIATLLVFGILWLTKARRILLFCLIASAIAWFQMAITENAGASVHHTVLLWPIPHMFIAIAFAEASLHLRRIGAWALAAVIVYLAATNLLVTNEYFYQLARRGALGSWSDAIYRLSEDVASRRPSQVVIADWGIANPIIVLNQGKLPVVLAGDSFFAPQNGREADWNRGLLENGLWLGHVAADELVTGVNERTQRTAGSLGYRREVLEVVTDSSGRPVFEIFRFVRYLR